MAVSDLRAGDPDEVGPYRLVGRLGAGGMGIVYLARSAGRLVALKVIRPELADDAAFRVRFRREVEAGRRVGGVCTARYLEADTDGPRPFLASEFVHGPSLAELVSSSGRLDSQELLGLATGLAEALAAIHAAGLVHRDLKPSNILMGESGPRVIDFGIAQALDSTALTQSGLMVGSPTWMAPEQANGEEVTPAADVFAWGAVVAYAGTGRPPFGDGQPAVVLYRVVHQEPDLTGLDQALTAVVRLAMAKIPAERPGPTDLVQRLAGAAAGASQDTVQLATAVLARTWHAPDISLAPLPGPSRPRRLSRWAWTLAVVVVMAGLGAGIAFGAMGVDGKNQASPPTGAPLGSLIRHQSSTTLPTSTTSLPATTTTNPVRQILAPATTPPVIDECYDPNVTYSTTGEINPVYCPGGEINILAWRYYDQNYPGVMGLGDTATESQAINAMCSAGAPLDEVQAAGNLAAAYYGWPFSADPAFAQWPYYPSVQSNEC